MYLETFFPSVTVNLRTCQLTKLNGNFKLKATTELWNATTSMIPGVFYVYCCTCHHHSQANGSVMAPFIHLASLSSMQCWSRQVLCPLLDASNTWLQVDHWRASELQSCLWLQWIYWCQNQFKSCLFYVLGLWTTINILNEHKTAGSCEIYSSNVVLLDGKWEAFRECHSGFLDNFLCDVKYYFGVHWNL